MAKEIKQPQQYPIITYKVPPIEYKGGYFRLGELERVDNDTTGNITANN